MAATGVKEDLEDINQLFQCQICFHTLVSRSPRQLYCLHTFCKVCLEKISSENRNGEIKCSICRRVTQPKDGQVSNLPINFVIDQTIQMVKAVAGASFCSKCLKGGDFVRATLKCDSCDWCICENCRKVHDRLPGFSGHKVCHIGQEKAEYTDEVCKLHKRSFILFCETCRHLLCSECVIGDVHDAHVDDIKTIETASCELRNYFATKRRELQQQIALHKIRLDAKLTQRDQMNRMKAEILKFAETLKSSIDENAADLVNDLEQNHLTPLKSRINILEDILVSEQSSLDNLETINKSSDTALLMEVNSLTKSIADDEQKTSRLEKDGDLPSVNFVRETIFPILGRLDVLPIEANINITQDDLERLSKQLYGDGQSTNRSPKFIQNIDIDVDRIAGIALLNDGTAVYVAKSRHGLLRINPQGEIISNYTHDTTNEIMNISSFNGRVLCVDGANYYLLELSEDGTKLVPYVKRRIEDFEPSRACWNNMGIKLLFGQGTIIKLDKSGMVISQEKISSCAVSAALLDNKQCYVVRLPYHRFGRLELWDDKGHTITKFEKPPHEHHMRVWDACSSCRGTFIAIHYCLYEDCAGRDGMKTYTVSEYAPNGSFIRYLLTKSDGIHRPECVSCDSLGYLWFTGGYAGTPSVQVYKF